MNILIKGQDFKVLAVICILALVVQIYCVLWVGADVVKL